MEILKNLLSATFRRNSQINIKERTCRA